GDRGDPLRDRAARVDEGAERFAQLAVLKERGADLDDVVLISIQAGGFQVQGDDRVAHTRLLQSGGCRESASVYCTTAAPRRRVVQPENQTDSIIGRTEPAIRLME